MKPVGGLVCSPASLPAGQRPAWPVHSGQEDSQLTACRTPPFTCPWESQLHAIPSRSEANCSPTGVKLLLDAQIQP